MNPLLIWEAEDIHRAKQESKVGLILGFQSASPIEDDLPTSGFLQNSASGSSSLPTWAETGLAVGAMKIAMKG